MGIVNAANEVKKLLLFVAKMFENKFSFMDN